VSNPRRGQPIPRRRQYNVTRPVQSQQQPPADHVAQRPVGLNPVPRRAQLPGERPPAGGGIGSDQLPDERDIGIRDLTTSVAQPDVHGPQPNTQADRTQAVNRGVSFFSQGAGLTRRQAGAA
jgi:hypothetical protein